MKLEKDKRWFKLPILGNFNDYSYSTHLIIFSSYITINALILTLSTNPMVHKFIADIPMFFILLYLFRKILINDIKIFKDNLKKYIPFTLFGFVLIFVLMFFSSALEFNIDGVSMGASPNQEIAASAFSQMPLLGAFAIIIIAPLLEELIFRRSVKILVKNKFLYFFLSAFLFGMAHLLIGFTFPASFIFIIPYFIGGLGWAIMYHKSNNIWCAIIPHLLSNLIAAIQMLN